MKKLPTIQPSRFVEDVVADGALKSRGDGFFLEDSFESFFFHVGVFRVSVDWFSNMNKIGYMYKAI